jgi:hypothetical protein
MVEPLRHRQTKGAATDMFFRNLIDQLLCGNQDRLCDWRKRVIEALGANAHLVVGVVPELQDLIGRQYFPQELPAAEKRHRFNHAFRQFVRVFANPDHPLCLFLDDLQWADPASLALLQTLLADSEISHFLVIGAFRPREENGNVLSLNVFMRSQDRRFRSPAFHCRNLKSFTSANFCRIRFAALEAKQLILQSL